MQLSFVLWLVSTKLISLPRGDLNEALFFDLFALREGAELQRIGTSASFRMVLGFRVHTFGVLCSWGKPGVMAF